MDFYSTEYLNGIVESFKKVPSFFLKKYFTAQINSDREEVVIERKNGKARITPFVAPMSEGKVTPGTGSTLDTLKPAYLKDMRAFDPNKAIKRMAGEALGGALTLQERKAAIVAQDLAEMDESFERRKEVMAAEAIITGKLVIKGEGFDTSVDFQRPSDHTFALSGADKWDVVNADGFGTANVKKQLETYARKIANAGGGLVKDVIMDPLAWDYFSNMRQLISKEGYLNLQRGTGIAVNVDPTVLEDGNAEYKGSWNGFDFYVYQAEYIDPFDGSTKNIMPDKTVVMVGSKVEGCRYYGAIMDEDVMMPIEKYVDTWAKKNPSRRWYQLQSSPLMVPHRPYATLAFTVA